MVILGLILVLIAVGLGAALLVGTSAPDVAGQEVDIQLFDAVTINLNPLTLVIAGMAAMFLLWLGLVIIRAALERRQTQRRLRKEQELEARERREGDEREREELLRAREEEVRRRPAEPVGGGTDADATRPSARTTTPEPPAPSGATAPRIQEPPAPSTATGPERPHPPVLRHGEGPLSASDSGLSPCLGRTKGRGQGSRAGAGSGPDRARPSARSGPTPASR